MSKSFYLNSEYLLKEKFSGHKCGGLVVLDVTSLLELYYSHPAEFVFLINQIYDAFPDVIVYKDRYLPLFKKADIQKLKKAGLVKIEGDYLHFGYHLSHKGYPVPIWFFELNPRPANLHTRKNAIKIIDKALKNLIPDDLRLKAKGYFVGLSMLNFGFLKERGKTILEDSLSLA